MVGWIQENFLRQFLYFFFFSTQFVWWFHRHATTFCHSKKNSRPFRAHFFWSLSSSLWEMPWGTTDETYLLTGFFIYLYGIWIDRATFPIHIFFSGLALHTWLGFLGHLFRKLRAWSFVEDHFFYPSQGYLTTKLMCTFFFIKRNTTTIFTYLCWSKRVWWYHGHTA